MTRIEELCKHAHEICNNPKNDYKSTEDLCYIAMKWADRTMVERLIKYLGEQRDLNHEDLLDVIDSIPEEPVSENLKEA